MSCGLADAAVDASVDRSIRGEDDTRVLGAGSDPEERRCSSKLIIRHVVGGTHNARLGAARWLRALRFARRSGTAPPQRVTPAQFIAEPSAVSYGDAVSPVLLKSRLRFGFIFDRYFDQYRRELL